MIKYGFCKNEDFCSVVITTHQNQYGGEKELEDFTTVLTSTLVNNGAERELVDYALTVDMAKEISMLQRNKRGKQARRYPTKDKY